MQKQKKNDMQLKTKILLQQQVVLDTKIFIRPEIEMLVTLV